MSVRNWEDAVGRGIVEKVEARESQVRAAEAAVLHRQDPACDRIDPS